MVPMEPMTAAPSTSDLISIGDQNHDNLVDIGTPNIIESITMSGGNGNNPLHPKGVLISECLAGVIDFPKTNEKFDRFLHKNLKSGQINKVKAPSFKNMIIWAT